MSMREFFCPDLPAGFEKMAGFHVSTHNLERTGNLSSKVASCNLVVT